MDTSTAPHTAQNRPSTDGMLDKLARALQNRHQPGSRFGKMLRLLSFCHLVLHLGATAAVAGVLVWMSAVGERNLTAGFLLYLPIQIFVIPLLVLFPLALLTRHRWVCLLQLALALYIIGPYMGWRREYPAVATSAAQSPLKLLTFNRGEKGNESMSGFINGNDPHFMLLQEAGGRAAGYMKGYPQFVHGQNEQEFTLVSKLPLNQPEILRLGVEADGTKGRIVGTRTVTEWQGRQIALYNVHLPTPRGTLRSLMGPALLHGIISLPGTPWRKGHDAHMKYWREKERLTRELKSRLDKEPLPFIIAGDFNMPHQGYLYHYFKESAGGLQDAHAVAGKGYGFTFPGSTNNPLSFGKPWLRIDYIFASKHWQVRKCITEPKQPSQHRSLVAELTLKEP